MGGAAAYEGETRHLLLSLRFRCHETYTSVVVPICLVEGSKEWCGLGRSSVHNEQCIGMVHAYLCIPWWRCCQMNHVGYGWCCSVAPDSTKLHIATDMCGMTWIHYGCKLLMEHLLLFVMQEYALRIPMWLVHKLPEILEVFNRMGRAEKMYKVSAFCVQASRHMKLPQCIFRMCVCPLLNSTMDLSGTPWIYAA